MQEHPFLRRLIQPKQIPLLFSVTIIAGIFYHYAPKLTWLWIILSLVIQSLLFRLFDYVKKHPLLGGIAYVMTGAAFVAAAFGLIHLGLETVPFAPSDPSKQLNFLVWFLTPQSVLTTGSYDAADSIILSEQMQRLSTEYLGYTLALFTLFSMFIATTAYYFTLVRYRVLMSFVVMIFPFAIYAKENETMPVLSIIILLVCYFAVMIYCRQAHGEDAAVVQKYEPDTVSRLSMPNKKSAYAKVKPELLDGAFFNATGIFMAAATILVLVIPKPEVEADRTLFDSLLDFSALSDVLMDAISAFANSSDGSNFEMTNYSRSLFYADCKEPLNLQFRTFSNYDYDADIWLASEYDGRPDANDKRYVMRDGFRTVAETADPDQVIGALYALAKADPEFAETCGLQAFAAQPQPDAEQYYTDLLVESATYGKFSVFPVPLHVRKSHARNYLDDNIDMHMNSSNVMFRYSGTMFIGERYEINYLSDRYRTEPAVDTLLKTQNAESWHTILTEAVNRTQDADPSHNVLQDALDACCEADAYAMSCEAESQTPERVRQLAEDLTQGMTSDFDKAMAIRDYLRYNDDFTYSRDFRKTDSDNVETFLFDRKIGVCVQFASAMTEMCRAVGLPTRYAEGYSMSEPDTRNLIGGRRDFAITTDHGHAFVNVYIAGYGWMMLDPTSGNIVEQTRTKVNVLATLQYSGLILFCVALVLIVLLKWILPLLTEKLFRRKFRRKRDAEAVTEAFARLRKQWGADPSETARTLCEKQSAFLQVDLSELCSGFESAVYAERCDGEAADRVYQVYCAAYDAWKPACKRQRQEKRLARKAARRASGAKAVS